MFSPVDNVAPGRWLRSFLKNDRGTIAVTLALTITPMVLSMGLAVDLTRSYMARTKLTAALDTAALAAGAVPSMTASQVSALVTSYLQANFPDTNLITVGAPTITQTSTTITVNATAQVKTTFMGLGGFKTVGVGAQSTVSLAKSLEVALVLDNTGSLSYQDPATGNTNISALKTAAGHLVVTLFGTATKNNPQTRVGIVPYVAAVNAGSLASSMIKNPPALTPNDPTGWTGCVVERNSTFATLTPAAVAADLDTPISASAANYLAQYLWPKNGHATELNWKSNSINTGPFTDGYTAAGPNQSCPTPIVPLTNNLQPLLDSIGANSSGDAIVNSGMEDWQNGGTIGSIGMSWGYRMLSPSGPLATAGETVSNWNTSQWQKAVVLMTDGVNNINSNSGIADYTGAPGTPTVAEVDTQEEQVCDALKAQHVVIYSVFLSSNSTPGPALAYCAGQTAGQGDGHYYYVAQNQAALFVAFDSIVSSLTKLRVTQ